MDAELEHAKSRVGRVINGRWRLDRVVGVGGMAAVYQASNQGGPHVAIKMLHPEISANAEMRERFLREGYAANKIPHEGVVKVLDDDTDPSEGAVFLVMELLQGEALDSRLERKGGSLPAAEVLNLGYQAADALAAAHQVGIIHRDVKPDNLFITEHGQIKILDFGLARLQERAAGALRTQEGAVLGTPAFMSPEHAMGRWSQIDPRADVWSLGATLFTLLTGKNVHEGATAMDVLVAAATKPPRSLGQVAPNLPASVVQVIDRAIAFKPDDRYATMAQFRDALAHVVSALSGQQAVRPSLPGAPPAHGYLERAPGGDPMAGTVKMDSSQLMPQAAQHMPVTGGPPLAATVLDPQLIHDAMRQAQSHGASGYTSSPSAPGYTSSPSAPGYTSSPSAPGYTSSPSAPGQPSPFRHESWGSVSQPAQVAQASGSSKGSALLWVVLVLLLAMLAAAAVWFFVLRG